MIDKQANEIICIALIDDDKQLLASLKRGLSGYFPSTTRWLCLSTSEEALSTIPIYCPHVIVLDLNLSSNHASGEGFHILQEAVKLPLPNRTLVMTGAGGSSEGIKALSLGAASFLTKPVRIEHLAALIEDGINQATLKRKVLSFEKKEESYLQQTLIGTSHAIQKLRYDISFLATTNQSVMLLGETGVGKGLSAHALHRLSVRNSFSFTRYQPSGQTVDLITSDLFGHTKGSFTGAVSERKGLLEESHRGTLFLDELDEFPWPVQVMLLGVLQEQKFRRVGDNKEISSDFRLITATNADLSTALKENKLRKDFLYRVSQAPLTIPPLRERTEDIPALVENIRHHISKTDGILPAEFAPEALDYLSTHHWPGNIRELHNVVSEAIYRSRYEGKFFITVDRIKLIKNYSSHNTEPKSFPPVKPHLYQPGLTFQEHVATYKRQLLTEALEAHNNKQSTVATVLQIDRSTMRKLLKNND